MQDRRSTARIGRRKRELTEIRESLRSSDEKKRVENKSMVIPRKEREGQHYFQQSARGVPREDEGEGKERREEMEGESRRGRDLKRRKCIRGTQYKE